MICLCRLTISPRQTVDFHFPQGLISVIDREQAVALFRKAKRFYLSDLILRYEEQVS